MKAAHIINSSETILSYFVAGCEDDGVISHKDEEVTIFSPIYLNKTLDQRVFLCACST